MKLRIALAATTFALVAAPLAGTSHASMCNPNIPFDCLIVDTVCGGKICQ
jgi:hypothetical protein